MAKRATSVPEGADRKQLEQLLKKSFSSLERDFKVEHATFLAEQKHKSTALMPLVKAFSLDPEEVEQSFKSQRTMMRRRLSQERPPKFEPATGHNPSRYAPYDFQWISKSCGGITYCSQYGPNAATGQHGASLGIFNAGGASANSGTGFWFYSQAAGTLHVTVEASVWGRGYVFSGLFGYASAYAGLRVFVREHATGLRTFQQTTDIYDNWGVLEFDIRSFDWVRRSVSLRVPVQRNTWYEIWGLSRQSAYAGGIADSVSNFVFYNSPISYFMV